MVEPEDRTLALRGWSYPLPPGEPQRVTLRLNGAPLATLPLSTAPESFRLEVAAERFVAGENRLELVPARRLERPGEPAWATGWDLVRFDSRAAPAPPRFEPDGTLLLPARSALALALELPAGSWLAWERLHGAGGGWLEVGIEVDGEAPRALPAPTSGRLALTPGDGALVELALRARGGGEVRLEGARIHSPGMAPGMAPDIAPDAGASPMPAPARPPNLVLYVIDTLRADHLGAYGYPLPTSPAIDAFAREGVLFRAARAQSSWTKPAVATLLTGLYPITHGADRRARGLAPGVETLAALVAPAGYQSAFFTTNPTVTAKFGFDRGFDEYRYLSHPRGGGRGRGHVDSGEIHRAVVDWLDRRDPARPFLLVVHTLDPHDPYRPPERFRRRFAPRVEVEVACCVRAAELAALSPAQARTRAGEMIALYDGEIAQNDESFGALLAELARRGLGERSAILLTSDHGEEFYDHGGWRHAETLYEEVLRVPMILRLPGGAHAGRTIEAPADQIDVVPTLLALAGLAAPAQLPGGSWLPALAGGAPPAAESLAWLEHPAFSLASATLDGWKGIRARGGWRPPLERGGEELYRLADDPGERRDLARDRGVHRRFLLGRLAAAEARFGAAAAAPEVAIDAELERSLRALGYF